MITQTIYNQEVICIWGEHQIGQWICQSDVSSGQIWALSFLFYHRQPHNKNGFFPRTSS